MWARFIAAVLTVCALAAPAVAQDGRWLRAESDNFIVYGLLNETQIRQATQSLEDFDRTLRLLKGMGTQPAETKLEVYLVRSVQDLRAVWPTMPEHYAGFYRAGSEQIAAFLVYDTRRGAEGGNQVLFHEYAHHFMLHYFADAYPKWYVEGWADYVSTTRFLGRTAIVGEPSESRRSWISYGGGVLPINALLAPERVSNQTAEFSAQFYANSWFAVTYLSNHANFNRGLTPYVEALGRGADAIEAFEPAFGMTPEAFRQELLDFQGDRIGVLNIRLPEQAAPNIVITRMPAAVDELLLPLARMRSVVEESDRVALAAQVEAIAARYPDDTTARIAAARAAYLRDDFATARTRLEAHLATNETDAEARYLLAYTMLQQAYADPNASFDIIRDVRRELVRGFRANPNHFPTLFLYAHSFSAGPEPMSEEQLNVMARALELAPQADHIRLTFAEELMDAGRYVPAVIALRPMIYAPHGGGYTQRARELFDEATQRLPARP